MFSRAVWGLLIQVWNRHEKVSAQKNKGYDFHKEEKKLHLFSFPYSLKCLSFHFQLLPWVSELLWAVPTPDIFPFWSNVFCLSCFHASSSRCLFSYTWVQMAVHFFLLSLNLKTWPYSFTGPKVGSYSTCHHLTVCVPLADVAGDLMKQMKHGWTQQIMRGWPEGESSKDQEERMVFNAMWELITFLHQSNLFGVYL